MDEGIKMTGFNVNSPDYGTIDGAVTNALHIFGGFNNDGRFYPLNNADSIAAYNKAMPHGKEGFSIIVKSGFYSCISAGGPMNVLQGTLYVLPPYGRVSSVWAPNVPLTTRATLPLLMMMLTSAYMAPSWLPARITPAS